MRMAEKLHKVFSRVDIQQVTTEYRKDRGYISFNFYPSLQKKDIQRLFESIPEEVKKHFELTAKKNIRVLFDEKHIDSINLLLALIHHQKQLVGMPPHLEKESLGVFTSTVSYEKAPRATESFKKKKEINTAFKEANVHITVDYTHRDKNSRPLHIFRISLKKEPGIAEKIYDRLPSLLTEKELEKIKNHHDSGCLSISYRDAPIFEVLLKELAKICHVKLPIYDISNLIAAAEKEKGAISMPENRYILFYFDPEASLFLDGQELPRQIS